MWLDADSALAHLDRLNAAALALAGNRADAEDLVQETVLTLLHRPRRLRGTSELAYLMTMLRNRHIDLCRSAARRRQSPAVFELEEAVDPRAGLRPDRVAEDREVVDAVHALDVAVPRDGRRGRRARPLLQGGRDGARRAGRHRHVAPRARPRPRDPRGRARAGARPLLMGSARAG